MKDKVRDISFRLLPGDRMKSSIAEETSPKEFLRIERNKPSLNQLPKLVVRVVLSHSQDLVLRPPGRELRVSRQDHPALLAGHVNQLMKIIPPVVNHIVSQHSQSLCQFSQHAVDDEFHQTCPT